MHISLKTCFYSGGLLANWSLYPFVIVWITHSGAATDSQAVRWFPTWTGELLRAANSACSLICDAVAPSSGQTRVNMQGFREMFSLCLKQTHLICSIYCVFCVCFVSGNTGAEAFIIWVRGPKYVCCGDTACALFLTTDPLGAWGANTQCLLNTWAGQPREEGGWPLQERPSVFWAGVLGQDASLKGLWPTNTDSVPLTVEHQAGCLHFESVGVGFKVFPAAAGVSLPFLLFVKPGSPETTVWTGNKVPRRKTIFFKPITNKRARFVFSDQLDVP